MKIDKSLSIPLYQQVKDYLEEKIIIGEWSLGYQLPSEKELAVKFDVSNITVKRAIHELVNEGVLERHSGKGTFVIEKKEAKDISTLVSLKNESWSENKHYPHKTIKFKKEAVGEKVGKIFGINSHELVYNIQRLKVEEDKPLVIEHSFIPASLFQENLDSKDFEDDLIYNILVKKYRMKLDKARIFFSTMIAGEYEHELLNVPVGKQLFVIDRHTVTEDKRIIEYSRFILKQDQSKFFLEIQI